MSFPVLRAIFRKDWLCLRAVVGSVALIFMANAVITRLELLPALWAYAAPVLAAALVALVFSVVQNDSAASLTDDWLCRPVPKRELVAAKLLLLLAAAYLPNVVGAFLADLSLGYPVSASLLDAMLLPDELLLFLVPLLLFVGAVTRTLVQGFGVLFAIFIVVFVLPTPFVREPGPLDPGIRDALFFSGMRWIGSAPAIIATVLFAALGLWLVYWRRQLLAARLLLGATLAVAVLCMLAPTALLPWSATFALQQALGPPSSVPPAGISLRSTRACFPATRRSELLTDAAFAAATHGGGLKLWEEEALQGIGPDSIAFITDVEPRGLPLDWGVKLDYVQARYSAGGKTLYSLRPARYFNERVSGGPLTHAWMLPAEAVQALQGKPVRFELAYSLTLMKPREYHVPTDGRRHAVPGLGYCSAVVDEAYDRIDVDCFGAVSSPAQISAELSQIPASRVYGDVDLAPSWARWAYGRRARLAISSPRLANHDHVTVIAWDVAAHLDRSLAFPGILGAEPATCALPSREHSEYQNVRWQDTAPHQARQINVDDGVQLEVLDFGGQGSPLVLLPGLGATAHSYDDLAPLLARRHRVVALTRRGAGYSSRPDFGFDTPRLAQDVLEVMNAMDLDKVVLVGHSIAGDELTWAGVHHPGRFQGLVYLDAAYDRSGDRAAPAAVRLRELARALPPEPPTPPAALRDYAAMSRLLAERGHVRYPEGELIAFFRVNSPFIGGTPNIDARTQQAISAAIRAPEYRRLRIPALAIYAFENPDAPPPPWFGTDAGALANRAELARIGERMKRENIERFRNEVTDGQVLELRNATHGLIWSNPREVLEAIEKFCAAVKNERE